MDTTEINAIAKAVADIVMTRLRTEIREGIRAALGTDQTDIEKLASLPRAERKAFFKAQMLEDKRLAKLKG